MQCKRGYTLMETMAAMSLTSAVLAALAGWLTMTLRHEREADRHLLRTNSRDRLAAQFRQDVRAAQGVAALDAQHLQLQMTDRRQVSYLGQGNFVKRVEGEGDEVLHQEQYAIAAGVEFRRDEESPNQVTLGLGGALKIEAVLGTDHRFEGGVNGP